MRKSIKLMTLFIIALTFICLVGCDNNPSNEKIMENYNTFFTESLNACKNVTIDYAVKDSDVVVYDSFVKARFSNEGCDVSVKESKLNSKYVLESNENTYTDTDYTREEYCKVTFDVNYINTVNNEENLQLEVKKYYFTSFIGIEDIAINSNADVVVTMNETKIDSIVASFKSTSDKDVTITIVFSY